MHLLFWRLEIKGQKPVCLSHLILPEPTEGVSVEKVSAEVFMHTDEEAEATKETKPKNLLKFQQKY